MALPNALERKYPNAGRDWAWQWVFPAPQHYTDRVTGEKRRHHLHEPVLQRAVKEAVQQKAGIPKAAGWMSLLHYWLFPIRIMKKRNRAHEYG